MFKSAYKLFLIRSPVRIQVRPTMETRSISRIYLSPAMRAKGNHQVTPKQAPGLSD